MPILRMREWEHITFAENASLANFSFGDDTESRTLAEKLTQAGILEIVELRQGLSIRSTSYVGRIQLGSLQITIKPKISHDVLLTLFRYAYNLRDTRLMKHSEHNAEPDAFQDILIQQLISEVTNLISRGLHRKYRQVDADLAIPKGRINIRKIVQRAGIGDSDIPVIHHPRLEDSLINQVLLAGIILAVSITTDVTLRSRLRRLTALLEVGISPISLNSGSLTRVRREMTRLTAHYEPSITLIEMLLLSTGVTLETKSQQAALPGFLFDMNNFFERLVSRFLNENLNAYTVHDQYRLKGLLAYHPEHNPKRRLPPTPRPDFVVTDGKQRVAIVDAKYRDLWEQSLPRDMLYQLAVYALSQGWNGRAIILYPCVIRNAIPQIIDINDAMVSANKARIILTPVDLNYLSEILQDTSVASRTKRAAYAEHLVLGSVRTAS